MTIRTYNQNKIDPVKIEPIIKPILIRVASTPVYFDKPEQTPKSNLLSASFVSFILFPEILVICLNLLYLRQISVFRFLQTELKLYCLLDLKRCVIF